MKANKAQSGRCNGQTDQKTESLVAAPPHSRTSSLHGWASGCLLALVFGALCARAQNSVFTYQGRVTDNGTNFNGTGLFKFALVTNYNAAAQATATAVMGGASPHEFVNGFTIVNPGNGYTSAPTVTITGGGGSGATGQAELTGTGVSGIEVLTPGSGYSSTPTVAIAPPPSDIVYTTFWSNDGSSENGSQPTLAVSISVSSGLFTVAMGNTSLANMTQPISYAVLQEQNTNLQLLIWFNDGVNGFALLTPPQPLTPAPMAAYALTAGAALSAEAVPAGGIQGAITASQLPAGVVTSGESVTLNNLTLSGTLTLPSPATITSGPGVLFSSPGNYSLFAGTLAGGASSGTGNTGIGYQALYLNTSGFYNTALGANVLYNNNNNDNTGIGFQVLFENTSGFANTAVGSYALNQNGIGSRNTAIGVEALEGTTGSDNIALGNTAGDFLTSGNYNIDIGNSGVTGESGIIRIGTAGEQTDTYLTGVIHGNGSGLNGIDISQLNESVVTNGTGNPYYNFFAGIGAGAVASTASSFNTGVGFNALLQDTSGTANTAVGTQALQANTSGGGNTATGYGALYNNTNGAQNTATGQGALFYNASGQANVAFGYQSLFDNNGSENAAVGYEALYTDSGGSENTAIGFQALENVSSGSGNIGVGYLAGYNLTTGFNNIDIGNSGNAGEGSIIRIGKPGVQTNAFIVGISGVTVTGSPVYVSSTGQLGVGGASSERFKKDIKSMGEASEALLSLNPVTFRYKPEIDPEGKPQFGLVAEEVEKADPDLVVFDKDHSVFGVRYEAVNAMLLNEFLKEHRNVENQETEIESLKSSNRSLEKRLEDLEKAIGH